MAITVDPFAATGFNALDWIGRFGGTKEEDIAAVASWIMSDSGGSRGVRDDFFPKSLIDPDKIVGLDSLMKDAVELKFIPAPLTDAQVKELIQISPRG